MQYQLVFRYAFLGLTAICVPALNLMADEPLSGRRLAVVVGVNTYRPNSGLTPLSHAVKDAHRLGAVLQKSGFTVIEMTHEVAREPGKEAFAPNLDYIRDQISGILDFPNLGAKDSILITLHGHGVHYDLVEKVTRNGKEFEQKTAKFYFCPADSTIQQIRTANDLTEKNRLLALDEIYESLGACKAATKLLIVDACRNDPSASGAFREGETQSLTMPKLAPPPGGIAAFLSCRENQRAVEDSELGQGVFTHFLAQGLEGKADQPLEGEPADGIVTLAELTTYTANNTYAFVFKKHKGLKQSPEIKGEFDANLPLVQLTSKTPAIPSLLRAPFDTTQASASQSAWAKHLNCERSFKTASGVEMVLIPPGEYLRGSNSTDVRTAQLGEPKLTGELAREQPQHLVQISQALYISKFEITQSQFEKQMLRNSAEFSAKGNSKDKVQGLRTANFPMEYVTWFDCLEYCNALSLAEGKSPYYELTVSSRYSDRSIKEAKVQIMKGTGYRLPTEAEWEYACRAGTVTLFPFGNRMTGSHANVDFTASGISSNGQLGRPNEVGHYSANQFGLFDMNGNVWEWCQDGFSESAYQAFGTGTATVNPKGEITLQTRVMRGGSWSQNPWYARSALRYRNLPSHRSNLLGIRIMCDTVK